MQLLRISVGYGMRGQMTTMWTVYSDHDSRKPRRFKSADTARRYARKRAKETAHTQFVVEARSYERTKGNERAGEWERHQSARASQCIGESQLARASHTVKREPVR